METDDTILDSFPPPEKPVKQSFLRGVTYALLYYAAGFVLAGIAYFIFGQPYAHAPGAHHVVLGVTFAGGVIMTFGALMRYFFRGSSPNLQGFLFTHMVVIVVVVVFLYTL